MIAQKLGLLWKAFKIFSDLSVLGQWFDQGPENTRSVHFWPKIRPNSRMTSARVREAVLLSVRTVRSRSIAESNGCLGTEVSWFILLILQVLYSLIITSCRICVQYLDVTPIQVEMVILFSIHFLKMKNCERNGFISANERAESTRILQGSAACISNQVLMQGTFSTNYLESHYQENSWGWKMTQCQFSLFLIQRVSLKISYSL